MVRKRGGKSRGRPRKTDALRHPGGQVVRTSAQQQAEDAMATVVAARQRVYDLPAFMATQKEAGSAIGRALLKGEITPGQERDAHRYERIVRDYRKAVLAQKAASGSDFDRTGGYDSREGDDASYVEIFKEAEALWRASRRALLEAGPLCHMAVETWVIDDIAAAHSMIGDLRVGLNALARLYRSDMRRED